MDDLQPIRKALRMPKFVLSEAIYLRTKKKLRGAGQVQVRGAHLRRKRFLPENTCFVDPEILWSYSALMWKQTGHKHGRGEDKSFLHKGVLSEEASRDEGALWKSYPQTVGSRLMVPRVDSPENHYEDS